MAENIATTNPEYIQFKDANGNFTSWIHISIYSLKSWILKLYSFIFSAIDLSISYKASYNISPS